MIRGRQIHISGLEFTFFYKCIHEIAVELVSDHKFKSIIASHSFCTLALFLFFFFFASISVYLFLSFSLYIYMSLSISVPLSISLLFSLCHLFPSLSFFFSPLRSPSTNTEMKCHKLNAHVL